VLDGVELMLDGTDNFETRYLINEFAVERGIPWIYGAAIGSYGITMPIVPGSTCCFSCLYPQPPAGIQPTCETAGVVNVLTSSIASFQVSVALQIPLRTPLRVPHYNHRPLERKTEADTSAGCPTRLRSVRTPTFFPSRESKPRADQSLRPECSTDPRPRAIRESCAAQATSSSTRRGSS
jgi:molybdopterin/thiamine biosynthesis adenylyltransferase